MASRLERIFSYVNMFCQTCSKLSYLITNKICVICNSVINKSTMAICDLCSNSKNQCAGCLKKILNKISQGGCRCK